MPRLSSLKPRTATLDTRLLRADTGASGATANQRSDAQRRRDSTTRPLYGTSRWRAIRADQLRRAPLCAMCLAEEVTMAATICDHVQPHRGDVAKFWAGPFASLCKTHHDTVKQHEEIAAARG